MPRGATWIASSFSTAAATTSTPLKTFEELFLCAFGLQLGRVGEPPELYRKLTQVKDPAAVLKRLEPESPGAFVNVGEMYDRDALVNERRLVPLVAQEPEELFEQ